MKAPTNELISKTELLYALTEIFGDLADDSGSYAYTEHGYEWLSVARVVEIIHSCTIYDD
jgi:hypothetical protein